MCPESPGICHRIYCRGKGYVAAVERVYVDISIGGNHRKEQRHGAAFYADPGNQADKHAEKVGKAESHEGHEPPHYGGVKRADDELLKVGGGQHLERYALFFGLHVAENPASADETDYQKNEKRKRCKVMEIIFNYYVRHITARHYLYHGEHGERERHRGKVGQRLFLGHQRAPFERAAEAVHIKILHCLQSLRL